MTGLGQNLWLAGCFFLSCYFYGAGLNPLLALPALLGPLGILLFSRAEAFERVRLGQPLFYWSCLAALLLIGGHHFIFSRSPDSSFIPSLVLACLPLWAFVAAILKNPRQLWLLLSVLVAVFALFSAGEFVFFRQRAHAPLRDPGNYATLLYLVWLPWLVAALGRSWTAGQRGACAVLLMLLLLAQLATHLRFSMLVAGGAPLLVLLAWWRYRLPLVTVGMFAGAIAAAFAVYLMLDAGSAASAFSPGAAEAADADANPRLLLWASTWRAIMEESGIHGAGLYAFSLLYPQFRSPLEQTTAGLVAHNDLLQVLLEGGVWLFVPLLALYLFVAWALLRQLLTDKPRPGFRLGWLLALMLALGHAVLNFLLYVLPLVLLVGVMLGMVFGSRAENATAGFAARATRALLLILLTLNVGWFFLDITSMGVLSGYKQAAWAAHFREDPDRLLAYTRTAQTLNGRRGLPVYAEAKLLEQRYRAQPSAPLATRVDLAYANALETDAWNPVIYLDYAAFQEHLIAQGVDVRDKRDALLARALALNPASLPVNASLLRYHLLNGAAVEARAVLANAIVWCELMGREPGAEAFFNDLARLILQLDAQALLSQLEVCQAGLNRTAGGGRRMRRLMQLLGGE